MSQDLSMKKSGIVVPVSVNTVTGHFEATVGGTRWNAATWAELEKHVSREAKKVAQQVEIPFTSVTFGQNRDTGKVTRKVRHGVAYGLHSDNGNVLARWEDDGSRVQLSNHGYRSDDLKFRRLDGMDVDTYTDLYCAVERARVELAEWVNAHKTDLKTDVVAELIKGASAE